MLVFTWKYGKCLRKKMVFAPALHLYRFLCIHTLYTFIRDSDLLCIENGYTELFFCTASLLSTRPDVWQACINLLKKLVKSCRAQVRPSVPQHCAKLPVSWGWFTNMCIDLYWVLWGTIITTIIRLIAICHAWIWPMFCIEQWNAMFNAWRWLLHFSRHFF